MTKIFYDVTDKSARKLKSISEITFFITLKTKSGTNIESYFYTYFKIIQRFMNKRFF